MVHGVPVGGGTYIFVYSVLSGEERLATSPNSVDNFVGGWTLVALDPMNGLVKAL